jgi:hypothetical protein
MQSLLRKLVSLVYSCLYSAATPRLRLSAFHHKKKFVRIEIFQIFRAIPPWRFPTAFISKDFSLYGLGRIVNPRFWIPKINTWPLHPRSVNAFKSFENRII